MPISKMPAWMAAQVGLGLANAVVYTYRSYERAGYAIKTKVRELSLKVLWFKRKDVINLQSANGADTRANSAVRIRIRADDEPPNDPHNSPPSSIRPPPAYTHVGHTSDAVKKLLETPGVTLFFLKPEPKSDRRILHIYNNRGEKVYVLVCADLRSQTWTLAYADAQQSTGDLATIYAGKKDGVGAGTGVISARAQPGKYILFNNPDGRLTYRKVAKQWTAEDGNLRTFYLNGAEPYHWTKHGLLLRSMFRNADFFITDPAVGSPAALPLSRNANAWRSTGAPAYFSPVEGRVHSPSSTLADIRQGSTSSQETVVDPAARICERETIAFAGKIGRDMTWVIAVNTNKISPEIVIATGLISILHQFTGKIVTGIAMPKIAVSETN